jgi:hypothetical protein
LTQCSGELLQLVELDTSVEKRLPSVTGLVSAIGSFILKKKG